MKIKLEKIEAVTGYKVKKHFKSIGLDIAERTGLCNISTSDKYAILKFNFLEFDKKDINRLYKDMYNAFKVSIFNQDIVIIEDSFLQRFGKFVQADVFKKIDSIWFFGISYMFRKRYSKRVYFSKIIKSQNENKNGNR